MYELIQVSDNSFYIESPARIGLVMTGDQEACLIDSGNDKSAGRKVKKILDSRGLRLRAIYNTHSHADHIGGNRYLQTQTGCRIYAPEVECDFIRHPIHEPLYLYGGQPPKDLCHKFLMAPESDAEVLTEDVLPSGWERIPLPGHSFNMIGFRTQDDVVYLADCLSSEATLDKYQINFLYDVKASLQTLEAVMKMKARLFVPAHTEPVLDIGSLAQKNVDKIHEIAARILAICQTPVNYETILKKLFDCFDLTMTFEQYVLTGTTLKSYLTWLKEEGRLEAAFEENQLLWKSV